MITSMYTLDIEHESFTIQPSKSSDNKIRITPKFDFDVAPIIQSMKDSETPKTLPIGYQPSVYDVICGRGKGHYNQPGNKRFRSLIMSSLKQYKTLKTKIDKTLFLNKIIDEVRAQNNGTANFIRQKGFNQWETLGDEQAREKVGHAIREALAPRYKSKVHVLDERRTTSSIGSSAISNNKSALLKHGAIRENCHEMESRRKEEAQSAVKLADVCMDEDMWEPIPVTSMNAAVSLSSFALMLQMRQPDFLASTLCTSSSDVLLQFE